MPKKYLGVGRDSGATRLVNVADPTSATDGATKQYVDTGNAAAVSSAQSSAAGLYLPILGALSTKTASYTLADTDATVVFNTASSALTATLPTAVGRAGRRFVVKKLGGATANPLTIATTSSQTIDGATTEIISVAGGFRELISDGANWHIIGGKVEPVIVTATSPANGGTLTLDASVGSVYRVATSVAGFILAAPTNPIDADSLNVEITPTVAFSLTVNAAILLTAGIVSPISVPANKKLFLGLRTVGSTWYLLAATQAS